MARVRGVQASLKEVRTDTATHSTVWPKRAISHRSDQPGRLRFCCMMRQVKLMCDMLVDQACPPRPLNPEGPLLDASHPLTILVGSWNVGDAVPPKRVSLKARQPCGRVYPGGNCSRSG